MLAWSANSGSTSGYNIYRGSQTGGPYTKLNQALVSATDYADSSVVPGYAYFYVVTAVDASGNESPYSPEVAALVPAQ